MEWKCHKAFEELKEYLTSPPLLTKPEPEESIFLYLVVREETLASVLTREEDKALKPIYYVRKVLWEV